MGWLRSIFKPAPPVIKIKFITDFDGVIVAADIDDYSYAVLKEKANELNIDTDELINMIIKDPNGVSELINFKINT